MSRPSQSKYWTDFSLLQMDNYHLSSVRPYVENGRVIDSLQYNKYARLGTSVASSFSINVDHDTDSDHVKRQLRERINVAAWLDILDG